MKMQRTILLAAIVLMVIALASKGAPNVAWDRAVYWDARYPSVWTHGGFIRDVLEYAGYAALDADQLKTWMLSRIADKKPSVVVFCKDAAPDTVVELASPTCTLRRYLNAGGKIVWYADIPMYYKGHSDGTRTVYGIDGATKILGLNPAGAPWNSEDQVTFTSEGGKWGLTEKWQSVRPTSSVGVRVLARDGSGNAAAWVRHYVVGDTYGGFIRLFDRAGEPNFYDVYRVAEYPNVPAAIDFDNAAESQDDIIGAFHYPWYRNPSVSGYWRHWDGSGYSPPSTWPAYYLPNYPDSTWNPSVQLYDSSDTQLLRWQDRAMARAGIDIAVGSWWGIGGYEDAALAKAIQICKSIQWCIYYEMEAYSDPTAERIHDDIKYVIDSYGPTRNYAKIDGKWLVLVYGAGGEETANRWRQAKAMLAASGYDLYLNGDVGDPSADTAPDPWDAVHNYAPVVYQGLTDTLPDVDDSAWISPGFWKVPESAPRLNHSLSAFTSAWSDIVANRQRSRFILVETWNEWHEGTTIEPGQEIVPDPSGYYPAGYDYGYDFIDALAPAAVHELRWQSAGHRAIAPVRLEAEELVWEDGTSAEGASEWRISTNNARIGASVLFADTNDFVLTVRARAVKAGGTAPWPELVLYLDDVAVGQWTAQSLTAQDYSTIATISGGIHRIEAALEKDPGGSSDVDLVIDFVDMSEAVVSECIYDLDGDDFIGPGDFGLFACCWLLPTTAAGCGGAVDCGDCDFDCDGTVGPGDFAFFSSGWLKECGDPSIQYPPCRGGEGSG